MGLAAAVTIGVQTGACGSDTETTSSMVSGSVVAAYGPPPTFCEENQSVGEALSDFGVICASCGEQNCCAEMEACGDECAACLDRPFSCASAAAADAAEAVRTCLANDCSSECGFNEICDSGLFAPTSECADCLGTSCCVANAACAADPDCLSCEQGDVVACSATTLDDDVRACEMASCDAVCP